MVPTQHFDKPGKSPFMDMELVPKYADEGNGAQGIMIEPAIQQNLGIRIVKVQQGPIPGAIEATASIKLNDRLVTILQARTTGYVDKVYPLAPGDVLASGTPIAELIVPEWEGAQLEFLALMRSGERSLARAARERMRLLGMPDDLIERVERTRKAQPTLTIRAPSTGLLQTLNVRNGMAVSAGTVLAQLNGLDAVWLDAAVPETQARAMRPGLEAKVSFPAFPGHTVVGKVSYILPEVDAASRTARVRIELQNPDGQLRPGLFAKVALRAMHRFQLPWVAERLLRVHRPPSRCIAASSLWTLKCLASVGLSGLRYQPLRYGVQEHRTAIGGRLCVVRSWVVVQMVRTKQEWIGTSPRMRQRFATQDHLAHAISGVKVPTSSSECILNAATPGNIKICKIRVPLLIDEIRGFLSMALIRMQSRTTFVEEMAFSARQQKTP